MADIGKINAVALANIAKVDAVAAAAIAKINGLVFTTAAGAFLLDTYTGAAAGYSTRRLATSATNLMRIREDAGDTETDIGYDSNNELDTAAIATHCGTANGYVVTWYDQSGNANNATQSTSGSQPQIYNGTAVITENGKPAMQFDGSASWLQSSGFGTGITRYVTHVANVNGNGTGYENVWIFLQNTNPWQTADFMQYYSSTPASGSILNFAPNARDLSGSSAIDQQRLGTFVSLAAGTEFFLDGTSEDSSTATAPVEELEDKLSIGRFSANYAYMKFQEMVIWNSDETSNRTGIETDINSEYLIYQPTDAPTSGLLADYTGAAAAYSVRQLSDKAVIALRVRRDSDDEEINIGFDANGELDSQAISDFCSTANGYVTRWWDQSTEGNHADQATDTSQPQIYNGSAVITENGKPALSKNSSGSGVLSTSAVSGSTTISIFNVAVLGDTGNRVAQLGNVIHAGGFMYQGGFLNFTSTNVNQVLTSLLFKSTDEAYLDGSQVASGNAGTSSAGSGVIGGQSASLRVIDSMQEIVFWNADQSSDRAGIETNINSEYLIYQPTDAPTSGLLATYTGAAAAYSVRQLANTAVLSMRVRRDSDDVEQNFGFDSNGDLDTAGIASFCGTANGYVTRWWDQSTNGNHADQATDASQPQIYNGTAVITENGKPAVDFDSSNLDISISQTASNYAAAIVERRPSTQSGWLFDSTSGRLILDARTNSLYFDGGFRGSNISSTSQDLVFLSLVSPSSGAGYVNGAAHATGLSYTQKALGGTTKLGSANTGGVTVLGTIQEFVLWPSDLSGNRSAIETNINDYFDIYT